MKVRLVVLLLAGAAFVGPALAALLGGCSCQGRVEVESRSIAGGDSCSDVGGCARPDLRSPDLSRAVPSPGGPL